MLWQIEKFEKKANKLILKLISLFVKIVKRLIPQKWQKKLQEWEFKYLAKKANFTIKGKLENDERILLIKRDINKKKEVAKEKIEFLKEYDYKGKALEKRILFTAYVKTNPWREIFLTGLLFFWNPIKQSWYWVLRKCSIRIENAGTYAALTMVGVVATYGIYYQSKAIYNKGRKPASAKKIEYEIRRPTYYKQQQRTMFLTHLKFPVYYKPNMKGINSLNLDFKIRTNYRRTLQYLESHQAQLRDHLLMYMEPVMSEFPLEQEGRDIISEKIKVEINKFLAKNNVKGVAEEVKINYVLGTSSKR